ANDANELLALNDVDLSVPTIPRSATNSWVTGSWVPAPAPETISHGSIYRYVNNIAIYKCPGDRNVIEGTGLPRYRSFFLSCYLGGPTADTINWGVQPLYRTSQIRNSARTLAFLDEDEL